MSPEEKNLQKTIEFLNTPKLDPELFKAFDVLAEEFDARSERYGLSARLKAMGNNDEKKDSG